MANSTDVLKTAADVRGYFLSNWRDVFPELLVPRARVRAAEVDANLVQVDLQDTGTGPVRTLLFVPVASGEPRFVRGLLPRLRQLAAPERAWAGFLVPYMAASGVRLCREAGIGFLDCCGNALLRFNEVVIQITGNRNRFAESKRLRKLFHDKATIPARILLDEPDEWLTTREIAERGDLSLGWVSTILQSMDREGYVERKSGGGTRLADPVRLMHDWLADYAFEQNMVFPFQARGGSLDQLLQRLRLLEPPFADRYALTLGAGLEALDPGSEREELHVYLPDLADDEEDVLQSWQDLLDLRPAGLGANCFLVRPTYENAAFFGMQASRGLRVVSDLQLYLDLYHYPAGGRQLARRAVAPRLPFEVPA